MGVAELQIHPSKFQVYQLFMKIEGTHSSAQILRYFAPLITSIFVTSKASVLNMITEPDPELLPNALPELASETQKVWTPYRFTDSLTLNALGKEISLFPLARTDWLKSDLGKASFEKLHYRVLRQEKHERLSGPRPKKKQKKRGWNRLFSFLFPKSKD
jgi:hypothetical protein